MHFFMGPGGVGKTSVSSAFAASLAESGKKVLLVSLDPAKRLGTIMGLESLNTPVEHPYFSGLYCVQQDTDTLLREATTHFSKPEQAEKIFAHPFYKILRSGISGPTEYMSLFSLHNWYNSGDFDHIVVDTAPHVHAVRVLNMPTIIKSFQDNGVIKKMIFPLAKIGSAGIRLFQGVSGLFPIKLFGVKLFQDLASFMVMFEDTINGFYHLSGDFQEIIAGETSQFCFVGTPFEQSTFVFETLGQELESLGARFSEVYLNKTIDPKILLNESDKNSFFVKLGEQQNRVVRGLKKKCKNVSILPTVNGSGLEPIGIVKKLKEHLQII